MKTKLLITFLLLILTIIFSVNFNLNMNLGDSFSITNYKNFSGELPSSFVTEDEIYFRADGSSSKYNFEIDGMNYKINITDYTYDSTVLFINEYHEEKNEDNYNFLLEEINKAEKYIYMSLYDIELEEFYNIINQKADEGIEIKIVTETDNKNYYTEKLDRNEKIDLKYDGNYRLMHNKFIIVDGYLLITGSTNLSHNGINYNNNNLLFLYNNEITENYMLEFIEQFEYEQFGKKGKDEKEYKDIEIKKGKINTYFTPDENYQKIILNYIDNAEKEIKVMIFTFTDSKIAQALADAYKRGVEVKVITETFQSGSRWSVYGDYQNEFPFILDKNNKTFHHKLILIDDKHILTGSYNFTKSALEYNDENAVIINGNERLYRAYEEEFDFLWEEYSK
ncbi:MAG: phospholipase D-like domain-containing protein [Thermotogota bacterium]